MPALRRLERLTSSYERGMIGAGQLQSDLIGLLAHAAESRDPEYADALIQAIRMPDPEPERIAHVAHSAFRAVTDGWEPIGDGRPLTEAADAVRATVHELVEAEPDAVRRARLLGALPPQWADPGLLRSVAGAASGAAERIAVLRALLQTLRHHESSAGAFRIVVRPFLESDEADALDLVVDAWSTLTLDARRRREVLDHLDRHRAAMHPDLLLRISVRLSIETDDARAAACARAAIDSGLPADRLPVAALVLWIHGDREGARDAAAGFASASRGWGNQAAASLAMLVAGLSEPDPAKRIGILAPSPPAEGLVKRPATVGALVGRTAFLRAQAFARLGRGDEAVAEAEAVVRLHGRREYDLHLQAPDAEFDVRLGDRLAVTPDEVQDARAIVAAHPEIGPHHPFLLEGSVIWRDESAGA